VCDVYDADALREAVVGFGPEAVMHQLTDLPDDAAQIGQGEANSRIRIEGTANLVAAAQAAGATRFVAQSIAWTPAGGGASTQSLEDQVLAVDGVVIRYGQVYGPGTYHPDTRPEPPRIHIDEAARRTLPALDLTATVLTLVED
jgi:nucleoside-diphosphate-sugar epimerase